MLWRFRKRPPTTARYNFYVWQDGTYVHVEGGTFQNDSEATQCAETSHGARPLPERPLSLDTPHLHVVREDGVHIITLGLSDEPAEKDVRQLGFARYAV
ncbi:MAG TPA: hypothetical protein VMK31_09235 [Sphingomicrobium sp.]|nr:hypothetical protein [Sphingomicrobium sp.]